MRRSSVQFYSKQRHHHNPTGRHRLHEEPVPAEILDVMTRRDDLRKRDPTSPELPRLNYDIQNRIYAHKRQKWRDFVETLDQKTCRCHQAVEKLLKELMAEQKREAENEAITFNGISFLIVQAASHQVQPTVQHVKAGKTHFFR